METTEITGKNTSLQTLLSTRKTAGIRARDIVANHDLNSWMNNNEKISAETLLQDDRFNAGEGIAFLPKARLSSTSEIDRALQIMTEVVHSGEFTSGPYIPRFETALAQYLDTRHVTAVNSGTQALIISLQAAGVQAGDEVIVPSNSFAATENAIYAVGATPVLADVAEPHWNMGVEQIEQVLTKKTRAILFVHLYGFTTGIKEVASFCRNNGLRLIEDACQAIGCDSVGQYSDLAAMSFNPFKNFGVFGKAGAVLTNDPVLHEAVREISYHGFSFGVKNKKSQPYGYNSQIDNLQAAIGLSKLETLSLNNFKRKMAASIYLDELKRHEESGKLSLPAGQAECSWHLFPLELNSPPAHLLGYAKQQHQIELDKYYPVLTHQQPPLQQHFQSARLPLTERKHARLLHLPLHNNITAAEIYKTTEMLHEFFSN